MENEKDLDIFDEDDFFGLGEEADNASAEEGVDTNGSADDNSDGTADDGDGLTARLNRIEDADDDSEDDAGGAPEGGAEKGTQPEGTTDYAAMAESDLAEINKAFPSVQIKSLLEIKDTRRYGELRDMGLSAKEAFLATSADMITANAERVGANKATGKAHLQSVARKAGAKASSQMTNAERSFCREFFPEGTSDEDIERLFAKTKK